MRTLYIDCHTGAAGDMLLAALGQLLPQPEQLWQQLRSLPLPQTSLTVETARRAEIEGTLLTISTASSGEDALHGHSTLSSVLRQIENLPLPQSVCRRAQAVYRRLGQAEAQAHRVPQEQVCFHEVGDAAAVLEVVGCCLAVEALAPDAIIGSQICLGHGLVRCAHGLMAVPTPATAALVKNLPTFPGELEGELLTPTAAALLAELCQEFAELPAAEQGGIGLGHRVFSEPTWVGAWIAAS